MVDFTGGVVESFDLMKPLPNEVDLREKIEKSAKRASLMSCSIRYDDIMPYYCLSLMFVHYTFSSEWHQKMT